ncbi:MAG: arginine repressor [bacterium]|jgi:transcriptional regulator of arginine metabolism
MKIGRQSLIIDIIRNNSIETQEELAEHLKKRGIGVTQATVSRDIKELSLIKIPTEEGKYRYSLPPEDAWVNSMERAKRLFRDSLISLDYTENIIVVKTLTGNANAVADIIDNMPWPEIVGTVAGDDTIFVAVRDRSTIKDVMEMIEAIRR